VVVCALVGFCVAMPALVAHAADSSVPGVLIIHSNQRPTPAQIVIEDTLRTVVPAGFGRPVEIFSEYLDDEWASIRKHGAAEATFLREKYSERNIRVVVADALPALQFAMQFRGQLFAGVPVVHIAVARDRLERIALPKDVLGNTEDHDPTLTLDLALPIHPDTRRVVLIRGASDRDRLWDSRFGNAVARLESGVETEQIAGLGTAELLKRVSALP